MTRYEAMNTLEDYRDYILPEDIEAFNMAIEALKNERPKGHWIRHEHGSWTFVNDKGERGGWIPDYECNLCGSRGWEYAMNFCPNCGARMKGADDEAD